MENIKTTNNNDIKTMDVSDEGDYVNLTTSDLSDDEDSTKDEREDFDNETLVKSEDDRDLFEDLYDEPRDVTIYNMEDLRYDWIEENDIEYSVRVQHDFHYNTSIHQVKNSINELLEDNDKPDLMKWLEASRQLEVFCAAAAEAGRDVIDFDMEMTEILDQVWDMMEHEVNEENIDNDYADDDNGDEDEHEDEFNVGNGDEGPEYYNVRM